MRWVLDVLGLIGSVMTKVVPSERSRMKLSTLLVQQWPPHTLIVAGILRKSLQASVGVVYLSIYDGFGECGLYRQCFEMRTTQATIRWFWIDLYTFSTLFVFCVALPSCRHPLDSQLLWNHVHWICLLLSRTGCRYFGSHHPPPQLPPHPNKHRCWCIATIYCQNLQAPHHLTAKAWAPKATAVHILLGPHRPGDYSCASERRIHHCHSCRTGKRWCHYVHHSP